MHTVIEIRPYRGGWQCYEGPGIGPYWIGDTAKEDAISYATARAKFGRGEIRVLNHDATVQTIIPLNKSPEAMRRDMGIEGDSCSPSNRNSVLLPSQFSGRLHNGSVWKGATAAKRATVALARVKRP